MSAQQTITGREALESLFALNPLEIDGLPWEPVEGKADVQMKTLWRLGDFVQALVRYQPGATTAGDPHLAAHHHVWVVAGAGTIAGRRLVAGSYLHVPPNVRHGVTDVGPEGLTLLQMHRPHAMQEAEALATGT